LLHRPSRGAGCGAASPSTPTAPLFVTDGAPLRWVLVPFTAFSRSVSSPPLAVPPSSLRRMVMVAEPLASAAGVNVSVPSAATAGAALNRAGLVLPVTSNASDCPDSLAGPLLMPVAQPVIDCGPASSLTTTSAPFVNNGGAVTGSTSRATPPPPPPPPPRASPEKEAAHEQSAPGRR